MAVRAPNVVMHSISTVRWSAERGFSLIEMLVVVALVGVISAIAVPMMKNTIGDFSLTGDARGLSNAVSLAKLRAASSFSQARVFVDLSGKSYRVETWQKDPAGWVTEGGIKTLSTRDTFGFGVVANCAAVQPGRDRPGFGMRDRRGSRDRQHARASCSTPEVFPSTRPEHRRLSARRPATMRCT